MLIGRLSTNDSLAGNLSASGSLGGRLSNPSGGADIPSEVRNAILALFEAGAYAETGLTDEIAIIQSWAAEVTSLTVSPRTLSLNGSTPQTIVATTIPSGSAVVWSSSDTTIATVVGGVVTGVSNGSCTITASAGTKSATCSVTVSGFAELVSISAVYTQSGAVYEDTSLDSLKADLVVTATYSDSSTAVVTDYTLSGTLEAGTSTITVTYQGKFTTFNVTVTENVLYSLQNHTFNNSNPIATGVYPLTTDKDITFAFDVDFAGQQSGTIWKLFACINGSSPWAGLSTQGTNSSAKPNGIMFQNMTDKYELTTDMRNYVGNFKYIVTHAVGTGQWHIYYKIGSASVVDEVITSAFVAITGQLTVGGTASASQVFNGTVNTAKVYDRVLTTSEITAFMG